MSSIKAVVLSGGGGRGAYQIGVWKALRKLNIKYDIVTGTSIGSINGVFMTYDDYKTAYKLWNNIDYNKVFNINKNQSIYNKEGKKNILINYAKAPIKGGLDIKELRKTIIDNINIDKFYESNINYGLVTVKFPSLKPVFLTKKDIKKENLVDYMIASSSAFPAFKMAEIDNEKYIDGGFYDNIPINLAISMGADEVIAVDLRAVGKKRQLDKNIKLTIISPKSDLGSFLVMEKYNAKRAIKYGYHDTLKVYNMLEGNMYTFKKGSLNRNYKRIKNRFYLLCKKYVFRYEEKYDKIYGNKENVNLLLENLASAFEIDDVKVYRTSVLNMIIKRKYNEYIIKKINRKIDLKKVNKEKINKEIICYIYDELKDNNKRKLISLLMLFPKNYMCALYLKTIMR